MALFSSFSACLALSRALSAAATAPLQLRPPQCRFPSSSRQPAPPQGLSPQGASPGVPQTCWDSVRRVRRIYYCSSDLSFLLSLIVELVFIENLWWLSYIHKVFLRCPRCTSSQLFKSRRLRSLAWSWDRVKSTVKKVCWHATMIITLITRELWKISWIFNVSEIQPPTKTWTEKTAMGHATHLARISVRGAQAAVQQADCWWANHPFCYFLFETRSSVMFFPSICCPFHEVQVKTYIIYI